MGRTPALDDALPATGRLRVLDGLRFAAALAVVLFHFTGRDSIAWPEDVREVFPFLSRITVYGGFGPYLFFMISGFVVLMSAWGRPVHSFVASRVGRLYPAYWVAVLLTAAVLFLNQGLIDRWGSLGPSGVAMNLTMFQSAFGVPHVDGVFWTLWVELKFYLLLALLAMAGITRGRLLALCLIWPVAGALAAQAGSPLLVAALEPVYAPFFCIGILLYLVHREGWSASSGLLLALNYCFALYTCSSYFVPWTLGVAGSGISFRGVAVLLTLSILAIGLATLTRLDRLDWRWLTFLGALTYPLYLVHQVPGWCSSTASHPCSRRTSPSAWCSRSSSRRPTWCTGSSSGRWVAGCAAPSNGTSRGTRRGAPCHVTTPRSRRRGPSRPCPSRACPGAPSPGTQHTGSRPQPEAAGGRSWMRSIVAVVEIDGVRGK
jgi:peptidoglycan/LPS O-acetylase OafA/YrhL